MLSLPVNLLSGSLSEGKQILGERKRTGRLTWLPGGLLTFQRDLTALSCFEADSAVTTVRGDSQPDHHRSQSSRHPTDRPMGAFAGHTGKTLQMSCGVFSNIDQAKICNINIGTWPYTWGFMWTLNNWNYHVEFWDWWQIWTFSTLQRNIEAGSRDHEWLGAFSYWLVYIVLFSSIFLY